MTKSYLKFTLLFVAAFIFVATTYLSASAQEVVDAEFDKRYQLALKIQALQPISEVAEKAVEGMAIRYPEGQRVTFKNKMMRIIDFTALEKDAARSMADTFTLPELKVLYAYRSSKEGKAIREKTPIYQTLVERNLFKYLDQALMQIRTGDSTPLSSGP